MGLLLEEKLTPQLRWDLVSRLNTDERWRIIIEGLKTYRIPVFLNVQRMNELVRRGLSPADWILEELFNRMCPTDKFCSILRECDLLEELELLTPPEPVIIEQQPGDGEDVVFVSDGGTLRLTCKAAGVPRPTYQWHHHNNPLPRETQSTLIIEHFSIHHIGIYWCRVTQNIRGHVSDCASNEVNVDLMHYKPELLTNLPVFRSVPMGHSITLTVEAKGYPAPRYEWYRSNTFLDDGSVDTQAMPNIVLKETSNMLVLRHVKSEHNGLYCCRVFNMAGQVFTNICTLTVFEKLSEYVASAKIALLIGNEDYEDDELKGLTAPSNDIVTMACILESLNFHVIALKNLTHSEMLNALHWFRDVLPRNAYAFFFFAGHGFLKMSSKFMMPIDCPKDGIQQHNCLCNEQVTQILANDKHLQLLVMLFDSCLIEFENLLIGNTKFEYNAGNCNIVIGTATRSHQNAYESKSEPNSVFVNQLQESLTLDKPIFDLFRDIQKEFKRKVQQPSIFAEGADNCKLTDPVKKNSELEEKLRSQLDFPTYEQDLYFSLINESVTVTISKHRNCFLNSIDIHFPQDLPFTFDVQLTPDIPYKYEKGVVTINDVQKAKSSLNVTVSATELRPAEGSQAHLVDSCSFTITSPIISYGPLRKTPGAAVVSKTAPERVQYTTELFMATLASLSFNW